MAGVKPVLVIACSDNKEPTLNPIPANQLYTGPLWLSYRKTRRQIGGTDQGENPDLEVWVLSAKFGLVRETTKLSDYDQRLTSARAKEIVQGIKIMVDWCGWSGKRPVLQGTSLRRVYKAEMPITFVGPKDYQQVLEEAGFVVEPLVPSGGWGPKRSALNAFLREHMGEFKQTEFDLDVAIARAHRKMGR